jgi:hypothetical protein
LKILFLSCDASQAGKEEARPTIRGAGISSPAAFTWRVIANH